MNKLRIILIGLMIFASVPSFSQDENKFVVGVDLTLRNIYQVELTSKLTVNLTASYNRHQLFAGIMSYYLTSFEVLGFDGGYRYHFAEVADNLKFFIEPAVSYMRGCYGYAEYVNYGDFGINQPMGLSCLAFSGSLGLKYNILDQGYFLLALGYGYAKIEEESYYEPGTETYYDSGLFMRVGFGINIFSNKK
ncbi:MAG: hypothetical protein A2W91_16685 [Bacteroidetes bacterium GWF2_38_335]|nr:MAG: hypothetical protein A2W91_16685 [Bacteroidetes bacterium GWF2_38_335]OFY81323.1 MAG: hypothetical protein A2281_07660 [Bacteroidetes bacterium RIFOXYA12_FULL_38_20]HBS85445.1 hypothetical protein [Bacteroidales bacterium]